MSNAINTTNNVNNNSNNNVKGLELIVLGHAFELGKRGEAGGAPSKDSIWGLAVINNALVSFSGRTNAQMFKFKTYKRADLEAVKEMAAKKFAGEDNKRTVYRDVIDTHNELREDLLDFVKANYYKAIAEKKLNNTATKR